MLVSQSRSSGYCIQQSMIDGPSTISTLASILSAISRFMSASDFTTNTFLCTFVDVSWWSVSELLAPKTTYCFFFNVRSQLNKFISSFDLFWIFFFLFLSTDPHFLHYALVVYVLQNFTFSFIFTKIMNLHQFKQLFNLDLELHFNKETTIS